MYMVKILILLFYYIERSLLFTLSTQYNNKNQYFAEILIGKVVNWSLEKIWNPITSYLVEWRFPFPTIFYNKNIIQLT